MGFRGLGLRVLGLGGFRSFKITLKPEDMGERSGVCIWVTLYRNEDASSQVCWHEVYMSRTKRY